MTWWGHGAEAWFVGFNDGRERFRTRETVALDPCELSRENELAL